MVAKSTAPHSTATRSTTKSPDAAPRYWRGYDRVLEKITRVADDLDSRKGSLYADRWWRFNTMSAVLGPLRLVAQFRREGLHMIVENHQTDGSGFEEHHCSCGLIVELPGLPAEATSTDLEARDVQFLAAPGHIDWRTRDPERYTGRTPEESVYESSLARDGGLSFTQAGMHRVFYGGNEVVRQRARQLGQHFPWRTDWGKNYRMPYRQCTCGLKVPAPDLIVLSSDFETYANGGTYWPNDPVDCELIQSDFYNAKGHVDCVAKKPKKYGASPDKKKVTK